MSENIESDKTLIIPPLASLSLARLVFGAGAADDAESRKPAASRHRQAPAEPIPANDKPHGRALRCN